MTSPFWRPLEPSEERDRLIDATLSHVPFDGWSDKALSAGAADLGIEPEAARRAFPGGALDLIGYHSIRADRRMSEAAAGLDLGSLGVRQRVAAILRARFEANATAREAIRAAMAVLALPPNLPIALALLYRTVDTAWWASGDTTTTFSFYTKRLLLGGVYMATLNFWLSDRSEGCAETWAFLDRRLADVMRIQRARGRFEGALPDIPELLRAFRHATGARRPSRRREWPAPNEANGEPPSAPPPPPSPER
jgi:ubiquinone biosynthesis protein COQ9